MNKKIYLGSLTILGVVSPLAMTVSCGSNSKTVSIPAKVEGITFKGKDGEGIAKNTITPIEGVTIKLLNKTRGLHNGDTIKVSYTLKSNYIWTDGSQENKILTTQVQSLITNGKLQYTGQNWSLDESAMGIATLTFHFCPTAWFLFEKFNYSRYGGKLENKGWTKRLGDFWQFICAGSLSGNDTDSNIRPRDESIVKSLRTWPFFKYNEFEQHFLDNQSHFFTNTQLANKLSIGSGPVTTKLSIKFSSEIYKMFLRPDSDIENVTVKLKIQVMSLSIFEPAFIYKSCSVTTDI